MTDRLPLGRAVAPNEAYFHRRGRRIAGEPDAADVSCPCAGPARPGRCRRGPRSRARARPRRRSASDMATRSSPPTPSTAIRGRPNRIKELAVFQHFGPNAAIDAAAEVLDELAVDVLRHRLADLGRIDDDSRRRGHRRLRRDAPAGQQECGTDRQRGQESPFQLHKDSSVLKSGSEKPVQENPPPARRCAAADYRAPPPPIQPAANDRRPTTVKAQPPAGRGHPRFAAVPMRWL